MADTPIAKAYVQIIPSATGAKDAIIKEMGGDVEGAGGLLGGSLGGAIKKAILAAGIGETIKAALEEGAALQQSSGGIETLFKDSADVVKGYADEAFRTANLSANEYMESVTSFSASLLQSLGGDTAAAAESANAAIIAMTDNANKMGTDMASIQNAYQGFAKQNYTMLDNLKLGYGGTKAEMERLLADATALSGIEYDIDSLSDVYAAIQVIQDELEISGTTAKEASETFSGSFATMASAAKNVLGKLTLGEDIGPALDGLLESVKTFIVGNLTPMVLNLLNGLVTGLSSKMPEIFTTGVTVIVTLAEGIADSLPALIPAAVNAVLQVADTLTQPDQLTQIIMAAARLIGALAKGIFDALPELLVRAPQIIINLAAALIQALPELAVFFSALIEDMTKPFDNLIKSAKTWGRDLVSSFVAGISSMMSNVINAAKSIAGTVKSYIGFSEPELGPLADFHTFAPDMIDLFAEGIRNGRSTIERAIDGTFDLQPQIVDTGYKSLRVADYTAPDWPTYQSAAPQPMQITVPLTINGTRFAQATWSNIQQEDRRRGKGMVF